MWIKSNTLRILVFLSGIFLPGLLASQSIQAQYSLHLLASGTYLVHENDNGLHLAAYTLECLLALNDTGLAVQADTTGSWIIPVIARGFRENSPGAGMNYLLGIRMEDSVLYSIFEEQVPDGFPRHYFSLAGYTHLQNDTWYHAAVTFDGTYLSLYLNGNMESRVEADLKPLSASLNSFSVGTALDISGTGHGHYNGLIDRISVWNYARSQSEIRQQLNHEITEAQPGLIMGIGCDEGSGKTLQAKGLLTTLALTGDDYAWQPGSPPFLLLPPECISQPSFSIGLISDPQYCDRDHTGTRYYRETLWKLDAAVDTFNGQKVDFVVTLGDLIDERLESFDSVLARYDKLKMPDYKVLGNHDFSLIPDSAKPGITGKLGMPGNYYDFHYKNWHFLVLDATELSAYAGVLHPELAEEADSLWQRVQGQVNAYSWNGGISRSQREWIRQKLSESLGRSEPVILFCHHAIYPYNNWHNLWNDTAVVELITQFPNVAAFINGHNHYGSYGFKGGGQFFTHRAMVESQQFNSFSMLSVYPDRIEIDGRGMNRDRTWLYNRMDTLSRFIRISDHILHTRDTSGTFIGKVSLCSGDTMTEKANFKLVQEGCCSSFFALSGDSLFMNTDEDLSGKGPLRINIQAMNCLKQLVSDSLILVFDSITILLSDPLPDTIVDVNRKSISLPLEKVFTDLTRHGFTLSSQTGDPEKATVFIENGQLVCWPHQVGETPVFVTALDTFTGYGVTDTFQLSIKRLFNDPPYASGVIDSAVLLLGKDTLQFMPDTLFMDPDGDTLYYSIFATHAEIISVEYDREKVLILPVQPGETDVTLTAEDNFGGSAQLYFHLEIKKDTPVMFCIPSALEFDVRYEPSRRLLVIVSPEEKRSVRIMLTGMSGKHSGLLFNGILSAGATCFSLPAESYPPGIYVLTFMGGKQILHCKKIPVDR